MKKGEVLTKLAWEEVTRMMVYVVVLRVVLDKMNVIVRDFYFFRVVCQTEDLKAVVV